MKNLLLGRNLVVILFLLLLVVVANGLIFSKQLNYGFRDVDWQVLYYFKLFDRLSLDHLLREIKVLGVYISESYYVGFLESLFGLNFVKLHQMTHFFKILAAISVYLMVLKIFKRKLLAFIASLIYTISYTHAGALFQLASGIYFLTTIFLALFLITYYLSLFEKKIFKWSVVSSILLVMTIILKPERIYPLIFLITLVELFMIITKFKSRNILLKRMAIILLPIMLFSILSQVLFKGVAEGFSPNQSLIGANIRMRSIMDGNLQLFLYPFASFGSIFLYGDYWKVFGQLNFVDYAAYIFSLIVGPVLRLGIVTFIIFSFIFKKAFKLTAIMMSLIFISGLIIYALNINWQHMDISKRLHFDANLWAIPAIFGLYVCLLGGLFFIKWIREKDTNLAPLVAGFSFAFLFVFLTWISSDILLIFMGPQRYLSIPSIGISLFIAGLLVVMFDRLTKTAFKNVAGTIFLSLAPLVMINYQVANKFFNDELAFAGLRATDQTMMKNKFRNLTGQVSKLERSLFYFDETADKENGYFNEGTVIAGFEYWTRFNMYGALNNFPDPGIIRTNIQCPEHTHNSCVNLLKKGLGELNGQEGIWYQDPIRGNKNRFYPLSNFYAYRFINKDIIDITEEVLEELK